MSSKDILRLSCSTLQYGPKVPNLEPASSVYQGLQDLKFSFRETVLGIGSQSLGVGRAGSTSRKKEKGIGTRTPPPYNLQDRHRGTTDRLSAYSILENLGHPCLQAAPWARICNFIENS